MNGFGRYIYRDGSYYVGMFKNGKSHGKGEYAKLSGVKLIGKFENGEFLDWNIFKQIFKSIIV